MKCLSAAVGLINVRSYHRICNAKWMRLLRPGYSSKSATWRCLRIGKTVKRFVPGKQTILSSITINFVWLFVRRTISLKREQFVWKHFSCLYLVPNLTSVGCSSRIISDARDMLMSDRLYGNTNDRPLSWHSTKGYRCYNFWRKRFIFGVWSKNYFIYHFRIFAHEIPFLLPY